MVEASAEQERVLALLQRERYPMAGEVFPTATLVHAVLESLVYLVEHTPPVAPNARNVQSVQNG